MTNFCLLIIYQKNKISRGAAKSGIEAWKQADNPGTILGMVNYSGGFGFNSIKNATINTCIVYSYVSHSFEIN